MPSNHLILCHPLLFPPSIFPTIRVFSKESVLCIRWPKYWSFSFSISPSNEYSGLIYFRIDWLDLLQSKGLSRVFSNTTVQKHQFFSAQLSLQRWQWQPTPVFLPGESLWTEESGRPQSMGLQRGGHDWMAKHSTVQRIHSYTVWWVKPILYSQHLEANLFSWTHNVKNHCSCLKSF